MHITSGYENRHQQGYEGRTMNLCVRVCCFDDMSVKTVEEVIGRPFPKPIEIWILSFLDIVMVNHWNNKKGNIYYQTFTWVMVL